MKTYEYAGSLATTPRSHPWTDARGRCDFRYYDFKTSPSMIRTALEDFVPWDRYSAVGTFYSLLEWLNGPSGTLESNDCAFSPPQASEVSAVARTMECSGRLMILYRDLALNIPLQNVMDLKEAFHHNLVEIDQAFEWGVVGTTIVPVRYITLPVLEREQLGHQLMVSFWAWGDSEGEVMANLGRVFENLSRALHRIGGGPCPR